MTPSGPEIAPAATFPPPLPSQLDRCPIRLAFLESQLRRGRWRCGRGRGAAFKRSLIPQKACRRSRLTRGDAGWEDLTEIGEGSRPRAGGGGARRERGG